MRKRDREPAFLDEDIVTPDDIRRELQEAIDAGGNRYVLDQKLKAAIHEAGGTIEDLAQHWTRRNRRDRLLAEYRAELNRKRQQPQAAPEEDAQTMLRELIKRFPNIARDVLDGDEGDATP